MFMIYYISYIWSIFLFYTDDLEEIFQSRFSCFAKDTNLAGVIQGAADWAQKWDMQFNVDKFKVMHIWTKNSGAEYKMDGKTLQVVNQDRDLGIIVEDTLKPTAQCLAACRKGNFILGMMRRGLESRSREVWLPVYRSLVRPHLEYCVQVWAPYYKKDIQALSWCSTSSYSGRIAARLRLPAPFWSCDCDFRYYCLQIQM